MITISKREKCRICSNSGLQRILMLPKMPWTDEFVSDLDGKEFVHDIEVFRCLSCGTVQTQHDVEVSEYYEDYTYAVSSSSFACQFMESLASSIEDLFFEEGKRLNVLEIGSGDGQQLRMFQARGHQVLGVEPSSYLTQVARDSGVPTIQTLFTGENLEQVTAVMPHVDVVLMTYTFDHIPEPGDTLNAIRQLLEPNAGVFVFENHNFDKIVQQLELCLFEHEHSIYLNETTARFVLDYYGFDTLRVNWLDDGIVRANSLIVGGTPRVDATPSLPAPSVDSSGVAGFEALIGDAIRNLESAISTMREKGNRVAGYGAGGRGVMTLAALSNAQELEFLLDKNPKREDIFTPKTHVKVVPISHLASNEVDYVIVFSFGYMDEIREGLAKFGYRSEQLLSMVDLLRGDSIWNVPERA
jgi:SAM-dependent methyltransferase